jgi:hypothetical protein
MIQGRQAAPAQRAGNIRLGKSMITKRRFIQGALLATLLPMKIRLLAEGVPMKNSAESAMQNSIAEIISEYAEQGITAPVPRLIITVLIGSYKKLKALVSPRRIQRLSFSDCSPLRPNW